MAAVLLTPFSKLFAALALVAGLIGLGEWHGRSAVHKAWDVAIAQQAMRAAATVIEAAENTARIETDHAAALRARADQVRIVHQEVIRYVEAPHAPCVVTPEFERVFDDVGRLHHAPADGLSAAAGPAGPADDAPGARPTDAEILAAYESAVTQLYALWDTYTALVQWVSTSHGIAQEGAGR